MRARALIGAIVLALSAPPAFAATPALVPDGESPALLTPDVFAQTGRFVAVAVSAEARVVAAATTEGFVRAWDLESGLETARVELPGAQLVAVSPSGDAIAAIGRGALVLFEPSGKELARRPWTTPTRSLAFAPADRLLVVGDVVSLVPRDPAAEVRVLRTTGPNPPAAASSVDETVLALAAADGAAVLVRSEDGRELRRFLGHTKRILAMAFSADGANLATASDDLTVRTWNVASGRLLRTLEGHTAPVNALCFTAGAQGLATAAPDGTLRLWNLATGAEVRRLTLPAAGLGVVFDADARVALPWGPERVEVRDIAADSLLEVFTSVRPRIGRLDADPSGARVVVVSSDGVVRAVDEATGAEAWRSELGRPARLVAVAADGQAFAAALGGHDVAVAKIGGDVEVVAAPFEAGAIALGGTGLVAAGVEGRVALAWTSGPDAAVRRLEGHKADVRHVAVSIDGKLVGSGAADGSVLVWDAATGALVARIVGEGEPIASIAFSPEGKSIAASGSRGEVRLWDLAAKALRWSRAGAGLALTDLRFSRDALRLTGLAGTEVRAFDAGMGDDLTGVPSGQGAVAAVPAGGAVERTFFVGPSGSVEIWGGETDAKVGWIAHGPRGTWLAELGGKLLRGDDGTLLVKRGEGPGSLVPVGVDAAGPDPKLSITFDGPQAAVDAGVAGRVVAHVSNAADGGEARWVTLSVRSADPSVRVFPVRRIVRLGPGEVAEVPIAFSAVSRASPEPREVKLEVQVRREGVAGPMGSATVRVRAPRVSVGEAVLDEAQGARLVRFRVANAGEEPTTALDVNAEFLGDGQVLAVAPELRLAGLAPGEVRSVAVDVPAAVEDVGEVRLYARSGAWPSHAWMATVQPEARSTGFGGAAIAIALVLALLAGLVAIGASFRFHPLALRLARDPGSIRRLELARVPEADRALRRSWRLEGTLAGAGLERARWQRLVELARGDATTAARIVADTVGGTAGEGAAPVFPLDLPDLGLRLARRVPLAVLLGPTWSAEAVAKLGARLAAEVGGPVTIALDLTQSQRMGPLLAQVPRTAFVVLSGAQVRDLVLADDPQAFLAQAVAAQRPRSELSPYRLAGGAESDELFVGRERELRLLTDRSVRSFLLVGPRQAGKSSLLKAARRRLETRGDVDVTYVSVGQEDLATAVAAHVGRPRPETITDLSELLAGVPGRPKLWLFDEVDAFVLADSRLRSPVATMLRTLSEEGRAYFVLTGFWHLYAAAYLNPGHPLRNFGEVVRLGPLDRGAARMLATRPMAMLGVSWDEDATLDLLLDQVGCRPHLLVAACKAVLETLVEGERIVTRRHVSRALVLGAELADELKTWRRDPVARAAVRAALLGEAPTRAELRGRLEAAGMQLSVEHFTAALDRLELSYLLVLDEVGKLSCPVPLLRTAMMREESLPQGLARDVAEHNAMVRARSG